MNLAVYSDLHVEFGVFLPPRNLNADVVVLAGDILAGGCRVMRWARRKDIFADRPVIFVAGNHEFYGERYAHQRRRMREEAARWGVHYLQQDAVAIGGVRFLGCTLWTDFELNLSAEVGQAGTGGSAALVDGPRREQALERTMAACERRLVDYKVINVDAPESRSGRRGLHAADTRRMHLEERAWLLHALHQPFDGPTVVVTHHAPHRRSASTEPGYRATSPAYASDLPTAFFEIPALWIHGHLHRSVDYAVGSCRVVSNPRGYYDSDTRSTDNAEFRPGFIVTV